VILSEHTNVDHGPGTPQGRGFRDWTPGHGIDADFGWRRDVALEMWVDVKGDVVIVRLQGVLDHATGANLVQVIGDCMSDGDRDLVLNSDGLRVAPSGWEVLRSLHGQVHQAGRRMRSALAATP
jgi:hypothetical protein